MMAPDKKSWEHARVSVVVFLLFQIFVLVTWGPLGRGELNRGLSHMGVIPMPLPFSDFRTITAGVPFYEAGGDPYSDGSYDFMERTFNYPPIWLKFSWLGLSSENVRFAYLALASLFSLGLFLLFWRDTSKAWYGYLPFLFSPVVFLALERCNTDLLMFLLIVAAVLLSQRASETVKNIVAGSLILGAAILKVFPALSLVCFLRTGWKRSLTFLAPVSLLCLVYFLSIKPDLDLIRANTPSSQYLSFGIDVIPLFVAKNHSPALGGILFMVSWIAVCVMGFRGYRAGRAPALLVDTDAYDVRLFRVGGIIFIAAYLLGKSFDYRLIFLLLTLPFAFRLVREDQANKRLYLSYLVLIIILYWFNDYSVIFRRNQILYESAFFINELAGWSTFYLVLLLQFKLLPPFVRQMIYRA